MAWWAQANVLTSLHQQPYIPSEPSSLTIAVPVALRNQMGNITHNEAMFGVPCASRGQSPAVLCWMFRLGELCRCCALARATTV